MSPAVVVALILGAAVGAALLHTYLSAARRIRRARSRVRRLSRARVVVTTAPKRGRRRGARR